MSLAVVPTSLLRVLGGVHRVIDWRLRHRGDKYRSEFYAEVWREAAAGLGASVKELGNEILEIRRGQACTRVRQTLTAIDTAMTVLIAADKPLVHRLLAEQGLRVPRHLEFPLGKIREAMAFAEQFGGEWVVKPAANSGLGAGITTGIDRSSDIPRAAVRAAGYGPNILLEQQAEGDVYRLLYLDGVFLDAVLRKPSVAFGDGKSTIRKLVRRENEARVKAGAHLLLSINMDMQRTLAKQGFSLSSTPKEGTRIVLKRVINENSAADNMAASKLLCDSVIEDGAAAAAAVGVRFAGIDLVTRDPSVPLAQSGGVILEVNTTPGFYYHYHRQGVSCPVAKHLLPYLLEESYKSSNLAAGLARSEPVLRRAGA